MISFGHCFRITNLVILSFVFTLVADAAEDHYKMFLEENKAFFKNFHGSGRSEANLHNPANLLAIIQSDLLDNHIEAIKTYQKNQTTVNMQKLSSFVGRSSRYIFPHSAVDMIGNLNIWARSEASGRNCPFDIMNGVYLATLTMLQDLCTDGYDYAADRYISPKNQIYCKKYDPSSRDYKTAQSPECTTSFSVVTREDGIREENCEDEKADGDLNTEEDKLYEKQNRLIQIVTQRMQNKGIATSQAPPMNEINQRLESQTRILLCLNEHKTDPASVSLCK